MFRKALNLAVFGCLLACSTLIGAPPANQTAISTPESILSGLVRSGWHIEISIDLTSVTAEDGSIDYLPLFTITAQGYDLATKSHFVFTEQARSLGDVTNAVLEDIASTLINQAPPVNRRERSIQ